MSNLSSFFLALVVPAMCANAGSDPVLLDAPGKGYQEQLQRVTVPATLRPSVNFVFQRGQWREVVTSREVLPSRPVERKSILDRPIQLFSPQSLDGQ